MPAESPVTSTPTPSSRERGQQPTHPFDAAAADYDTGFTDTFLGTWLREAVWMRLAQAFRPGDHVLEMGCGTGEDAVWLARRGVAVTATDASPAMLEIARRKAQTAGVADRVTFALLDLADLGPLDQLSADHRAFDGAFSNFGSLNCLLDRRPVARALAQWLQPTARVILVVMGPLCPWEVGWHLLRGQPRTAFRRLRSGDQAHLGNGVTVPVWYPTPRRLAAEFAPAFRVTHLVGIGALLPPSYMNSLVERWPRVFRALAHAERWLAPIWPWPWLSDHYLMALQRA